MERHATVLQKGHASRVGVGEGEGEEVLFPPLAAVEGEGEGEDVVGAMLGGPVVVYLVTRKALPKSCRKRRNKDLKISIDIAWCRNVSWAF